LTAPITNDLADLFPDDLIVERAGASDENGDRSFGAPFTIKSRIIGRTKLVADADGNEHVSSVQAVTKGAFGLTAKDRYTLPLRFSTNPNDAADLVARQPRAIAVDNESDENGAHHETVQFSNARLRSF
jgi:hypothetical protein